MLALLMAIAATLALPLLALEDRRVRIVAIAVIAWSLAWLTIFSVRAIRADE
jgi:hypothetical protein